MTNRRRTAVALLLLLLAVGCGDGKSGVCLPCWMGKDFSVAKSASDLRNLPRDSELIRARGIPDEAVAELARFPNLKRLNFGDGWNALPLRVSVKGLSRISELGLESLDTLAFNSSPEIDDECLRQVARIQTLTYVALQQCTRFSKAGLAALAGLPRLQGINVRGCSQIDDDWIDALAGLQGLQDIEIAGTRISPAGRARLRSLMHGCTVDDDEEMWAVSK